jgi:hypothetical protein
MNVPQGTSSTATELQKHAILVAPELDVAA